MRLLTSFARPVALAAIVAAGMSAAARPDGGADSRLVRAYAASTGDTLRPNAAGRTAGATDWALLRPLVDPADTAAMRAVTRELATSGYADTLYTLFGRPQTPIGLIGARGRTAGRLGEYIASRDSMSLDPGHITSEAQLRHALAHELGHRWQARAPREVARLWRGVGPIRDPRRYGHGSTPEHQAEAIAFAVHFLQATAGGGGTTASALALLDYYELLVPGTRLITRHLVLRPVYRGHPLRASLTAEQAG